MQQLFKQSISNTSFFSFRLIITNKCTHRCKYCHVYDENDELIKDKTDFMSFDTAKKIIDSYYSFMKFNTFSHISISLYGGEPLLNWEMLSKTISYGNKLFNYKVEWILNTNGSLISLKRAQFLKENRVDIHISCDGPKEVNNKYRVFLNDKPTHKRLLNSLELLKKNHYKLQFDSCLTDSNIDNIHELIDMAHDYRVDRIYLAVTDQLIDEQGRQLFILDSKVAAKKIVMALNYAKSKNVGLFGPWYSALFNNNYTQNKEPFLKHLIFETDGSYYLLHSMDQPLGNINSDMIEDNIFSDRYNQIEKKWNFLKNENCKDCDLYFSCKSYMLSTVKYHTGGIDGFQNECQFIKNIVNQLSLLLGDNYRSLDQGIKLKKSSNIIIQRNDSNITYLTFFGSKKRTYDYSGNLIKLLKLFKTPLTLNELEKDYKQEGLLPTLAILLKEEFIIPEEINEQKLLLDRRFASQLLSCQKEEIENFIVYSEVPFRLMEIHLNMLNDAYKTILEKLPEQFKKYFIDNKPFLYFAKDHHTLKKFWGNYHLPDWVSAFVVMRSMLIIDCNLFSLNKNKIKFDQALQTSSRYTQGMIHELGHVFLGNISNNLPSWLEEGFCEYISKDYNDEIFLKLVTQKKTYTIKELEIFTTNNLLEIDNTTILDNICYKTSHSLVYHLVEMYSFDKLIQFFQEVSSLTDFHQLFIKHFGITIEKFENIWQEKIGIHPIKSYRKLFPSAHLQVRKKQNKAICFNSVTGKYVISSVDIIQLFDYFSTGKTLNQLTSDYNISSIYDILKDLWLNDLLLYENQVSSFEERVTTNYASDGSLVRSLRMILTENCNMQCPYCYVVNEEHSKELLKWKTAKIAIDTFVENLKKHNRIDATIRFFGGEPLLNWGIIVETINYLSINDEIHFTYFLNTNGVLLNKEKADFLSRNNVSVIISLDGPVDIHDKTRKLKNGKNSFLIIDKNINLSIEAGCKISVDTTVLEENIDYMIELIDYIKTFENTTSIKIPLGFQSVGMGYQNEKKQEEIERFSNKMVDIYKYGKDLGVLLSGLMTFPFSKINGAKNNLGKYCSAAGSEITISPSGSLTPCSGIKLPLGNISNINDVFDSKLYKDLCNRSVGNIPECVGCPIEVFCAGGCIADAMSGNNNVFSKTKNCQFEKDFFFKMVDEFILLN